MIRIACLTFILCAITLCDAMCEVDLSLCGPQSLLSICESKKIKTTIEELAALSGYTKTTGTTMLGLCEAAGLKGLNAIPIKADKDRLLKLEIPAILHVDNNHYVVLYGRNILGKICIQEPFNKKSYISKDSLFTRWDGYAIIFPEQSNNKSQLVNKDRPLYFEETTKYFGSVSEGEILTHTFITKNIGDGPLTFLTRSTCSCSVASPNKNTLAPGETGEIAVEFDTHGKKGIVMQAIDVMTNNANQKHITLTLAATILGDTHIIPQSLTIENAKRNNIVSERIITDDGDMSLQIENIKTDNNTEAKINNVSIDANYGVYIPIDLIIHTNGIQDSELHSLDIKLNGDSHIIYPIKINKIGDITSLPKALHFGTVSADSVYQYSVQINHNNIQFENIEVLPTSDYIKVELLQYGEVDNSILKILLTPGLVNEKVFSGSIDIKYQDSIELAIPYRGLLN